VITPHAASPTAITLAAMRSRIIENVRRFAEDELLVGTIDARQGF
jgi:lactate dehydrogenase-like 2-hydroxyacid dehydrogenase